MAGRPRSMDRPDLLELGSDLFRPRALRALECRSGPILYEPVTQLREIAVERARIGITQRAVALVDCNHRIEQRSGFARFGTGERTFEYRKQRLVRADRLG